MHDLGVYVKNNFSIVGENILEDENVYYVFLFGPSTFYYIFLYLGWLRDHLRDVPWLDIFKHDATYAVKEITEWVKIGIHCEIPN